MRYIPILIDVQLLIFPKPGTNLGIQQRTPPVRGGYYSLYLSRQYQHFYNHICTHCFGRNLLFILEKEKYVWARPVKIEVLSSVTVKWDCLQAPVTYDSKYTVNMLVRLSAMVSYAEADERLQTMFSSILFYCRELKTRILIFCSIF